MKTGFKRILAALAMLFGSALLLASVHAQSSFTHSNKLIPNSVTAFSVATGGTLNFVPALQVAAKACPEDAKEEGDSESPELTRQSVNAMATKSCDDPTEGEVEYKDEEGHTCRGPADDLSEDVVKSVKIARISGKCDSSDAGSMPQKARYVFTVIQTGPFGAFKISRITDSGSTYNSTGTLTNGYAPGELRASVAGGLNGRSCQ